MATEVDVVIFHVYGGDGLVFAERVGRVGYSRVITFSDLRATVWTPHEEESTRKC